MSYDRTYKQTSRDYYFIYMLAWKPIVAQGTTKRDYNFIHMDIILFEYNCSSYKNICHKSNIIHEHLIF